MAGYKKDLSHRKIKKKIRFEKTDGTILANTGISLTQTAHSFLFGCGGFVFILYISEEKMKTKKQRKAGLIFLTMRPFLFTGEIMKEKKEEQIKNRS